MLPFGWFSTQDGSVTAGQPDRAHEIYPVNDHTADKATYTFLIDVPAGTTAAANGVLASRRTSGGRTLWRYEMDQPLASQVMQVAVGQLDIIEQGSFRNVQLRDVAASTLADDPGVQAGLSHTREHMGFMTSLVGKYPFDVYGVLAADELFGYALETQTLSLHPGFIVDETQVATRSTRSRSSCTSSRTSGSATTSRPPSGATSGSPRGTRRGTRRSMPTGSSA